MSEHNNRPIRLSFNNLQAHTTGFIASLKDKQPETRGTYKRALHEFTRWFRVDGNFRFRVEDVERYKKYLARKKNLAAVSVSTYLTALRRLCQYLVERRVLTGNPAKNVSGNRRPETHSRQVLPAGAVEMLVAGIKRDDAFGPRDYAIIRLMVDCALSAIEIVRMNVGDLAVKNDQPMLAVQGKGRWEKDQLVPLTPEVKKALDQYLITRGPSHPDKPMFLSAGNRTRGMRMTTRGVRVRVNGYLETAGIKKGRMRRVTPYSLRHTAAAMMADAGASADEIKQRMRLGSLATASIYLAQAERKRRRGFVKSMNSP